MHLHACYKAHMLPAGQIPLWVTQCPRGLGDAGSDRVSGRHPRPDPRPDRRRKEETEEGRAEEWFMTKSRGDDKEDKPKMEPWGALTLWKQHKTLHINALQVLSCNLLSMK